MANWVSDFLTQNPDLAARSHSGVRHGLVFDMGGNNRRIDIVGKPCHENTTGLWLPIDTTLVPITGNYYGAQGVPVRFNVSDRTVEILNSTYAQRTAQVGILDASNMTIKGAVNLPVGSRSGDSLIADGTIGGAGWQHVLRLTEDGVRETITLDSKPVGLPANAGDWLVLDTILGGVTFPDGWVDEFDQVGMQFSLPSAWDANRARPNCRRYARTVGGVQHLYTGIPVAWMATAVYPVVIDPDFAESTADLYITGHHATVYATARSTSTGSDATYLTLPTGQDGTSGYDVYRSLIKFDTSSIGTGNTVTQDNLKLTATYDSSSTDFDVYIIKQAWSGVQQTDYAGVLTSPKDASIWRNTSGVATGTQYASGNLTPSWVVRNGFTYFSLASARDYDGSGTAPAAGVAEYIEIASQDSSTVADRPILTVLYSSAPTLSAVQAGTQINLSWV